MEEVIFQTEDTNKIQQLMLDLINKFKVFQNNIDRLYSLGKISESEYNKLKNVKMLDKVETSSKEIMKYALTYEEIRFLDKYCDFNSCGDLIYVKPNYAIKSIDLNSIKNNVRKAYYVDHLSVDERREVLKLMVKEQYKKEYDNVCGMIDAMELSVKNPQILAIDFKYLVLVEQKEKLEATINKSASNVDLLPDIEVKSNLFKLFSINKRYYEWFLIMDAEKKMLNSSFIVENARRSEKLTSLTFLLNKENEKLSEMRLNKTSFEDSFYQLIEKIFSYNLDVMTKDFNIYKNKKVQNIRQRQRVLDRVKGKVSDIEEENLARRHYNNLFKLFDSFTNQNSLFVRCLKDVFRIKVDEYDKAKALEKYLYDVYDKDILSVSPYNFLQDILSCVMDYFLKEKEIIDTNITGKEEKTAKIFEQIRVLAETIKHGIYDMERVVDQTRASKKISIGISYQQEEELYKSIVQVILKDEKEKNKSIKLSM